MMSRREALDLLLVARPVGKVLQVAEVDGRLVGKPVVDLAENRQAADPGVEHTDGTRVSHSRSF